MSRDRTLTALAEGPVVILGGAEARKPELPDNPRWMDLGACVGDKAELIEATYGPLQTNAAAYRAAREVCAECPVAAECLNFQMGFETQPDGSPTPTRHRSGLWGGKSPAERYELAMSNHQAA